jgi:hypothetical protein
MISLCPCERYREGGTLDPDKVVQALQKNDMAALSDD